MIILGFNFPGFEIDDSKYFLNQIWPPQKLWSIAVVSIRPMSSDINKTEYLHWYSGLFISVALCMREF